MLIACSPGYRAADVTLQWLRYQRGRDLADQTRRVERLLVFKDQACKTFDLLL